MLDLQDATAEVRHGTSDLKGAPLGVGTQQLQFASAPMNVSGGFTEGVTASHPLSNLRMVYS